MNILYIACSCSPNYGSEDKIGWNIPLESAKQNNVWVIAREESRKEIEDYINKYNIQNPRFFYIEIPRIIKTLFKPPFYTTRLNAWHKRAFKLAKQLCQEENIDIIHQITPIEFRSIGNYGKIPGIKFVCGPIAGAQNISKAHFSYLSANKLIEWIRVTANRWFYFMFVLSKRLENLSYIFFANKETYLYLYKVLPKRLSFELLSDISISESELIIAEDIEKEEVKKCRFLVAGRLVYLKGVSFLLDVLARIPKEFFYECIIVGDGPERYNLLQKSEELHLSNKVKLMGNIAYNEMVFEYRKSSTLVFPSFREASGSVILEAMANGLPVVTINRFGGADIVNADCGWLYDGETKEEMIEALKNILIECIEHPEEVARKGRNAVERAKEFTWDKRAVHYQEIYERLLSEG